MMISRKNLVVPALAALFAATTGMLPAVPQTTLTTIRVASTPIDIGAEVYYAQALGYFKAAGLDVQIQDIDNGAAIAAAVAGNAADIGQSNVASLASAHVKGLPFVVIAPAGMYSSASPTTEFIMLANAPFTGAKDLEGKTACTNGIRNIGEIGGNAWLDKSGADWKSVKWVEIPVFSTADALRTHRVDVAIMSEPSRSAALASGDFKVVAHPYDALGSRWQIGAWFTSKSFLADHPDAVKKYVAVMQQTARWANAHQAESLKMLNDASKADFPKTMHRAIYGDKLDATLFQPVIDASAKYGATTTTFPAAELFADLR